MFKFFQETLPFVNGRVNEELTMSTETQIYYITYLLSICGGSTLLLFHKLFLKDREFFPYLPLFQFMPRQYPKIIRILYYLVSIICHIGMFHPNKTIMQYCHIIQAVWCILLMISDENVWGTQLIHFCLTSLSIFYEEDNLLSSKIFHFALYFHGGLQKMNMEYITFGIPRFFSDLASNFGFDLWMWKSNNLKYIASISALIEIIMSFALLFNETSNIACLFLFFTHAVILLAVGPLGFNACHGIWPWNVYCAIIPWILFFFSPNNHQDLYISIYEALFLEFRVLPWISFLFFVVAPFFGYVDLGFGLLHSKLAFQLHSQNFPKIQMKIRTDVNINNPSFKQYVLTSNGEISLYSISGQYFITPPDSYGGGLMWAKYLSDLLNIQVQFIFYSKPTIYTNIRTKTVKFCNPSA